MICKHTGRRSKLLLLTLFFTFFLAQLASCEHLLWFNQPSDAWEKGLPLGNGRLGMVVNGTASEHIVFNEDSLWSGWHEENNDREGSYGALQEIRSLIASGASQSEIESAAQGFYSLYGYGKDDFGAYQSFFDAHVDFGHDFAGMTNYRRNLDLDTAVSDVNYTYQGINFKREYFCSYPGQIAVMRFSADQSGAVDLTFSLTSLHENSSIMVNGNTLQFDGSVSSPNTDKPGMKFQAQLKFSTTDGQISKTVDGNGKQAMQITGATDVVVVVAGATNYKLSYDEKYVGDTPASRNESVLNAIVGKTYSQLLQAHIADYQNLFSRVKLSLDGTDRSNLPTDVRRQQYNGDDTGFEALLFQYGRYLLISCSRPGSMPANLQGLWNNTNSPPWMGDYHLNINMQMNYWPADLCNLSECMEPVVDWTMDLQKAGTKTAQIHYNSNGWVAHHTANVWGYTSPGPNRGIHMLEAESAAFLCQNLWDHYAFTADKKYLQDKAWPLMKGAAEFWLENLQEIDGGYLVVSPSYSPEQGPLSDSAFYPTMVVWELFGNCVKAAEALGTDAQFAQTLKDRQAKIQPLLIGMYGQLQEWRDHDLEETVGGGVTTNSHRHVSHLFSVYPGKQIIPDRDPDLYQAAVTSMNYRGDGATGWSVGWKMNLWARLLDGNRTHKILSSFISSKVYDNLWCAHPPFQIDGNFGYTAGVAEMLLQSHAPASGSGQLGKIHLLPALPDKWASGSIKGLKARGGVQVDLTWHKGELIQAIAKAVNSGAYTFIYGSQEKSISLTAGVATSLDADFDFGAIHLDAAANAAFSATLAEIITGADGNELTFSKISGPDWLAVSAAGALSGIPRKTEEGENEFVLSVSDGTLLVSINLTITVEPVDIESGLIGYWKFDETSESRASDSSSSNLDGQVSGTPNWSTGKIGGALGFDGASNYVTMLNPNHDIYAFSLWFYNDIELNKDTRKTLLRYGGDTVQDVIAFGPVTGGLSNETIAIIHRSSCRTGVANLTLPIGWHYLTINWNGTSYDIYIDKVKQQTIHASAGPVPLLHSDAFALGNSASYNYFDGKMDDVRLYNRALSLFEIEALFNYYEPGDLELTVELVNDLLSWTVKGDNGVKEYRIVDQNGELVDIFMAGELSYSLTIPEGVTPEINVVYFSGEMRTFTVENEIVVTLDEGWNIVSAPFTVDFSRLGKKVWIWDNRVGAYNLTDKVDALQGFWLFSTKQDASLLLKGFGIVTNWELGIGWNLVGAAEEVEVRDDMVIYGWKDGYHIPELLSIGKGYWIFMY